MGDPVTVTFQDKDNTVLFVELLEGGDLGEALLAAYDRLDDDPVLRKKAAFCIIGEPDDFLTEGRTI